MRRKVYVTVNADHKPDGTCRPKTIQMENGSKYEIDRVLQVCRAASMAVAGVSAIQSRLGGRKPVFLMS